MDELSRFIAFEQNIKCERRGGIKMYDVPGHYLWLTLSDLFEYYQKHYVNNKN